MADALRDEVVEVFSARNAIHVHAEIRKSLDYQLDLSRKAYRRMQLLKRQVVERSTPRRQIMSERAVGSSKNSQVRVVVGAEAARFVETKT
jgi:hypothetical protein